MSPNLPVGGSAFDVMSGSQEALPHGVTQLGLRLRWAASRRHLEGSDPYTPLFDPELDAHLAVFGLRHFFAEGWVADLQLPVGTVGYTPGPGRPTGRVSGLGDVDVGLRYDFAALWGAGGYRPSVTLRLALGLPTGQRSTISAEGLAPSMLATGSATWTTSAQLTLTQFVHKSVALQAWLSPWLPLARASDGLRPGFRLGYGAGALWRVAAPFAISVRMEGESSAHADEDPEGQVISSGGTVLAAAADLTWFADESLAVTFGGRAPFWAYVNGQQISESFSLGASLVVTIGGEEDGHGHGEGGGQVHGDEHEHGDEHGHGDEHDHRGGSTDVASATVAPDVATLAEGGASFDARQTHVPGKVTVVDFWADWCGPCKVLDKELHELARSHSALAVRRVEVPDFDTKVAQEHLPGVNALPTVWIVHPDGQRTVLAEESVDHILAAVRRALRAARRPAP